MFVQFCLSVRFIRGPPLQNCPIRCRTTQCCQVFSLSFAISLRRTYRICFQWFWSCPCTDSSRLDTGRSRQHTHLRQYRIPASQPSALELLEKSSRELSVQGLSFAQPQKKIQNLILANNFAFLSLLLWSFHMEICFMVVSTNSTVQTWSSRTVCRCSDCCNNRHSHPRTRLVRCRSRQVQSWALKQTNISLWKTAWNSYLLLRPFPITFKRI